MCVTSAALVLTGCHQPAEPPTARTLPAAAVRVQPVEAKSRVATEEVVGTVRAKLRATLEAKISGRIEQMLVVAGQSVKAGELLARLDAREIQARLDQAKAVLDQTAKDLQRFASLLQQQTVTQQEYDVVESRYRVAKAGLTEAETLLGYAKVEAPFAGVISRKLADQGDLATPGRPLLELEDPTMLQFETDISEALIGRIEMGARLPVHVSNLASYVPGVVSEIAPVADPNSRTFRIKLDLPPTAGLRLGQFGRVAVPVAETTAPRLPVSAVVLRGQMEIVFVVTNQIAQLRLVKTGKRLGDEIEILSGIHPGETVVVEGAGTLLDGQPVTLP